jgi:hypothetical protein
MNDQAVSTRANLALALGLATLAAWVAGVSATGESGEENGWIWVAMFAFGAAAVVAGMTSEPGRPTGRALAGTAVGALGVGVFAAFAIADVLG